MEFQITQNYGGGSKGWIYFNTDSTDLKEIEMQAKVETLKDWKSVDKSLYMVPPKPCSPTISVAEYKDRQKVKGGIRFKTKWR